MLYEGVLDIRKSLVFVRRKYFFLIEFENRSRDKVIEMFRMLIVFSTFKTIAQGGSKFTRYMVLGKIKLFL